MLEAGVDRVLNGMRRGDLVLPDLVQVLLLADPLPHAVAEFREQDESHQQTDSRNERADTKEPGTAGVHLTLRTRNAAPALSAAGDRHEPLPGRLIPHRTGVGGETAARKPLRDGGHRLA